MPKPSEEELHNMKSSSVQFSNITIIGVGLIGGSLALAIKHRFPLIHITGVDRPYVLRRALQRKAIDAAEPDVLKAIQQANLIILATPISSILKLLPIISSHISSNTIVTDTGSVKQAIVKDASILFPKGNFIGGHPMTGSEFSGINAAHPLLFQNAIYILTPTKVNKISQVNKLANFLGLLDARVLTMDAAMHDRIVAAVSHVPQLTAVALMNTVGKNPLMRKQLSLAAGGFRDMTRIASSPFDIWGEILPNNKTEIKKVLQLLIRNLDKYAKHLETNPQQLRKEFLSSRAIRSRIPRSMKGFITPLVDIAVFVQDKPGQLARLTRVLAKAKINIKDIELIKVREGRGGTFRISFDNRTIAQRAAAILKKDNFEIALD